MSVFQIGVIQKVDNLFKETLWDEADGLVKMGFQIKEVCFFLCILINIKHIVLFVLVIKGERVSVSVLVEAVYW